jgi:hypothetical protein
MYHKAELDLRMKSLLSSTAEQSGFGTHRSEDTSSLPVISAILNWNYLVAGRVLLRARPERGARSQARTRR